MFTKKNLSNHIFIAVAVLISVSLACSTGTIVQSQPTSQGGQGQREPTKPAQEPSICNGPQKLDTLEREEYDRKRSPDGQSTSNVYAGI